MDASITCPNCKHTWVPNAYQIEDVLEDEHGIVIKYRSVVGFGDIGTERQLRLSKGTEVQRNGNAVYEERQWTATQIEEQVQLAQAELVAKATPPPAHTHKMAPSPYSALIGRTG